MGEQGAFDTFPLSHELKRLSARIREPATTPIRSRRGAGVHGAGVLPGRRIDQHRLQAAGLGSVRPAIPGDREERRIHVRDKAQEDGNAADDRRQLQKDEGEQRAQPDGRFFPTIPHGALP